MVPCLASRCERVGKWRQDTGGAIIGPMRIHHLAFRCPDYAATTRFYIDVLGMRVVSETPGYSTWLALGGGVLMIEQASEGEKGPDPTSLRFVAFHREDLPGDLEERLAAAGVLIEDRTGYTIYFRDPDGRRIGASTFPLQSL